MATLGQTTVPTVPRAVENEDRNTTVPVATRVVKPVVTAGPSGAKYPPPPPPAASAAKKTPVTKSDPLPSGGSVGTKSSVTTTCSIEPDILDGEYCGAGRPTFIAYSSIVTGSKELRDTNKVKYWPPLRDTPDADLTMIGLYSKLYQLPQYGNKSNEPNYDAILVSMSLLNTEVFDQNFRLCRVNLASKNDENWGEGHYHREHADTIELYMEAVNTVTHTRKQVIPDYTDKHHLYIMAPLSAEACRIVGGLIVSLGSNLVIHYQGESRLVNSAGKLINMGLTPKDGGSLFANSFNWTAGMQDGLRLRRFISDHCDCYAVIVRSQERDETNLPVIYHKMNDYIHRRVFLGQDVGPPPDSVELLDVNVVQDMYDRDNFASVRLISENATGKVHLTLTGREVSEIVIDRFKVDILHTPEGRIAVLPEGRKKIFNGPHYSLLHFGSMNSCYWPEFHFNNTSKSIKQTYSWRLTQDENIEMAHLFFEIIGRPENIVHTCDLTKRTVEETVARAGKPGQHLLLFNEMLFTPGLHMAMHVVKPPMMMTPRDMFAILRAWRK